MATPELPAHGEGAFETRNEEGKELSPSQVRARVVAQHKLLRGALEGLDDLTQRVLAAQPGAVDALKAGVAAFLAQLDRHMTFEEAVLAPCLLDMDPCRPTMLNQLKADHDQQRHMLRAFAEASGDDPQGLADRVRLLSVTLLMDMETEERELLDPNVLRDDPVVIDQFSG